MSKRTRCSTCGHTPGSRQYKTMEEVLEGCRCQCHGMLARPPAAAVQHVAATVKADPAESQLTAPLTKGEARRFTRLAARLPKQ